MVGEAAAESTKPSMIRKSPAGALPPRISSQEWIQRECGTIGRPEDLDTGFWGARQLSIIATCWTQETVQ